VLLELAEVDFASSASVLGSDGGQIDRSSFVSPDARPVAELVDFVDLVDLCDSEREVDGNCWTGCSALIDRADSKSNAKLVELLLDSSSLGSRVTLGCLEIAAASVSRFTPGGGVS
jgi:hypothetical protein